MTAVLIIVGAIIVFVCLVRLGYAVWPHKTVAGADPVYDNADTWKEGLPPGLEYDEETQTLSGTPTQAGRFKFELPVPDADYPDPGRSKYSTKPVFNNNTTGTLSWDDGDDLSHGIIEQTGTPVWVDPIENTPVKEPNIIPVHPKATVKHICTYPTDMQGQIKGPCAGCGKAKE